jgi:hypothetical protein
MVVVAVGIDTQKIAPLLKRKGVPFIIVVFLWIIHVNVNVEIDLKATVDLNQIFASALRAIEGDEGCSLGPCPQPVAIGGQSAAISG